MAAYGEWSWSIDVKKNLILKEEDIDRNPTPTFGADPEFFIVTKRGTVVNSDRFFPSEKAKLIVHGTLLNKPMHLFFDGIQAEFNIHPHICREWTLDDIWFLFKKVYEMIGPNYDISLQACAKVRKDILKKADPRARIFGCDPDYDAYSGEKNEILVDPTTHLLRYAGGHIHIGPEYDNPKSFKFLSDWEDIRKSVKLLDILVGSLLVLLDRDVTSATRRFMYGAAGCFRQTKWGIEYRTPSPFWLTAPEIVSLVSGMTRLFFRIRQCKKEDYFLDLVDENLVRHAIDYNDFDAAMKIYKAIKQNLITASTEETDPFCTSGSGDVYWMGDMNGAAAFEWLVMNGVENVLGSTLAERWNLSVSDADFEDHGETAYGWFLGMWSRLDENKEFKKFERHFTKTKTDYM